jgi:hypothetical protein
MIDVHWTVGSFCIFLLYIAASVQSWRTGNIAATRREGWIWTIAAGLFCAMAANIAFGALDRLTNAVRSSVEEGWYLHRTVFQFVLIIALLVAGSIAVSLALLWSRAMPASSRFAFSVLLALIAFVLVRAVSLHAVDQILFVRIVGVTISTALEAGTAVLILSLIAWRRAELPKPTA